MEELLQVPLHFLKCLNHRMVDVGRDLGGHLVQAPCSTRATSIHLPTTVSRQLWSLSKDGDSTASLGNLCQCLVTPIVKNCFLMFRGKPPCFSLCPLPLVLSLRTTKKSLAPSSLHPPFRYLYQLVRSPLSFLVSRLNSPSSLSLASHVRCSTPFIIFVALC